MAFSPDGTRLASGDYGKIIIVWDLKTGRESLVLKGHPDPVFSNSVRHGGCLAGGNEDKLSDRRCKREG